jgi:uncharacterized protein
MTDSPEFDAAVWNDRCFDYITQQSGADAAHDVAHVRRVVANALTLLESEPADPRVVLPAAWLHDCVSVPKSSPDRARASVLAADQAVNVLRDWSFPEVFLPAIHHAIAAHSFSAGIPADTLEARVVQDADRLDALGAIGLARCLMLGGQMGRPLYAEDDPFCASRPPDDRVYTIDHFPAKLLTLAGRMQTEAGRAEAERRTEFLLEFLSHLRREIRAA